MKKVFDFLDNEIKLNNQEKIIVAVSGGSDSMCLLAIVKDFAVQKNYKVVCAHVNHNVRSESKEEELFVKEYCLDNEIEFIKMKINSYSSDNFQKEAREKRYFFFEQIIKKENAKYLLTAHHADDLIETILMRLVRGSTLRGYSGFSQVTNQENYTVLKPLINQTKEEILEYCQKKNIRYVKDNSNLSDTYTRNRYRKHIIPFLKKENKNVHNKFLKFSELLISCDKYLKQEMKKHLKEVYLQGCLDINKFLKLNKLIQQEILYFILEEVYNDDIILIGDRHVSLLEELINSSKPNNNLNLPNGILANKEYDKFYFSKQSENQKYKLKLEKENIVPNGKHIAVISKTNLNDNDYCRLLKTDIKLPLYIRNREDGDRIYIKGMQGSKKIKDIFINEKISLKERDNWPLVVDSENKIVWIPGLKKTKYDVPKNQNCDIILQYY